MTALVGAAIGRLSGAAPAEAGHDGTNVFHLGHQNLVANRTKLTNTIAATTEPNWVDDFSGLYVRAPDGARALQGRCYGTGSIGVLGNSNVGIGVLGSNTDGLLPGVSPLPTGVGVLGAVDAGQGTTGVYGVAPGGIGVRGHGRTFGVLAEVQGGSGVALRAEVNAGLGVFGSVETDNGSGVYGESAAGGNGVRGISNRGIGMRGQGGQYGVHAETISGTGVALRAQVSSGIGAYGSSQSSDGSGVYGENLAGGFGLRAHSTGVGLYAQGGTRAAVFAGDVEIRGRLILPGQTLQSTSGSASTTSTEGGTGATDGRAEYVGRARLVNGRASVALNRAFAAEIDAADYDVVLTPYGDSRGLFVAGRSPAGFEVREQQGGSASLEFSYRIVGRRQAISDNHPPGDARGGRPGSDAPIQPPEIPPAWRGDGPAQPETIPPDWRRVPPAAEGPGVRAPAPRRE